MDLELEFPYKIDLDYPFKISSAPLKGLLILFHGFTSYNEYWNNAANIIKNEFGDDLGIIRVQAPKMQTCLTGGCPTPGFYEFYGNSNEMLEDEEGILKMQTHVSKLLIYLHENLKVKFSKMFLMGFSQGGAVALRTGTNFRYSLGGIIACSTYFPFRENVVTVNKMIPILYIHGTIDKVLPFNMANCSYNYLLENGYQQITAITIKDHDHSVKNMHVQKYVVEFLKQLLYD
jgi:predicted esterase